MSGKASKLAWEVHRLSASEAAEYRDLRLEGLAANPAAFGASWAEEAARPLAWFADRLDHHAIFGGRPAASWALKGVVGLYVVDSAKQRHKGVVWGMFVRPGARGTGLAAALLARVLEHARQTVEEVRLTVAASNASAIRLYRRAGFEQYGLDRRALKIGDEYHDEVLMALSLRRPG